MKKIAIIGGGVAGLTAAIYALRANAEVTVFEQFGLGGLVATIDKIENYPSYKSVEGWQLAQDMSSQAKSLGLKTVRQKVVSLDKINGEFVIITDKGEYTYPSVVVATGTSHNRLGIEGSFVGKGVSYCATCDGAFYRGRNVAVVGGGNTAVREALYLADICAKTYLIAPNDKLSCEETSYDQLMSKSSVEIIYNAAVTKIDGADAVESITVYSNGEKKINVDGVFVAVGSTPVTDFIKLGIELERGYLAVDAKCQTSVKGLYACGDVTNGTLKQIVTACADGAKAGTYSAAYAGMLSKKIK